MKIGDVLQSIDDGRSWVLLDTGGTNFIWMCSWDGQIVWDDVVDASYFTKDFYRIFET